MKVGSLLFYKEGWKIVHIRFTLVPNSDHIILYRNGMRVHPQDRHHLKIPKEAEELYLFWKEMVE